MSGWDKLWEKRPHPAFTTKTGDRFLDKVKAEGDRLKEKAEKHDDLRAWCSSCEETIKLQFEELKKLEEIKNKVEEWDRIHMRDRYAAPSILRDLEKIIGYEEIDKELLEDFRKELK